LKLHGYDGEFFQKPSVVAKKFEFPMDGCAIFYNKSRLQLLESNTIRYEDSEGNKSNQGGQICRFRDVEANEDVVIVNTHLKAKDGDVNESVRVTQIRQLLQRLGTLTQGSSVATIFCGDLNADPFSSTYSIVSERLMSVYSLTSPCEAPHPADELGLTESCNGTVSKGSAQTEPPFTTWKFRFNEAEKHRTIDYIWYNSESKLVPYKRWSLPSKAAIGVDALPSAMYPSDHLSLLCEFRWRDSGFV
jgi:nocturnin